MSNNGDDDDDRSQRLKYDGTRGPEFRKFRRDFLTKSRGKFAKDDRHSFRDAFLRVDEGGTGAGAPALPAAAGGAGGGVNPAHGAAVTKRRIRHGQAFTFLFDSILDENLQQMLADLADTDPAELPGEAWDLIERECDEPDDDLEVQRMNRIWANTTVINTTGYKESTIVDFARHLHALNGKRPAGYRFSENEVAAKLLGEIQYPESLAKDAAKELRARGAAREFRRNAANDRDLNGIITAFDVSWRALFQISGGPIRERPAAIGQTHDSALLVDPLSAETAPPTSEQIASECTDLASLRDDVNQLRAVLTQLCEKLEKL